MTRNLFTTLLERFPSADPRVSDLKAKLDLINSFLPVIDGWKKEAATNKHLSEAGVASAYRKRLDKDVMREVREMNRMIADGKANLVASRKKASQPVYDQADTLGAAHRREVREFLRGLDTKERLDLLISKDADPIFINAALELPAALSGIPEAQAVHVRQAYAEKQNPDLLDHINIREEALGVMQGFATGFKDEIRSRAGLDTSVRYGKASQFDDWYDTGAEPEAGK